MPRRKRETLKKAPPSPKRPTGPEKPRPASAKPPQPRPIAQTPAPSGDLLPAPPPVFKEIPWSYGDLRITAMPRDPHWIFAYWEISDGAIAAAQKKIEDPHARCALRVYDTTHKLFDGLNANAHWDIGVDRQTNRYYIHVGRPAATFHIDIGARGAGGAFAPIARSSAIEMPRDSVSPHQKVDWSTVVRSGPLYAYRHRYTPKPGGPPPAAGFPEPGDPGQLDRVFGHLTGEGWARTEWTETLEDSRVIRLIRWTGPYLPDRAPLGPAGTYRSVEVLFQGERRVVRMGGGERFVFGPWRITLEAVGPKGERRTLDQWMIRHRWTTEEGVARVETPAILMRILGGQRFTLQQSGSDQRLAQEVWGSEFLTLGGSEWRWTGASEVLQGGASETPYVGASEKLFMGGTEIHFQGASDQRWAGASELHLLGGSETIWGLGASESMP